MRAARLGGVPARGKPCRVVSIAYMMEAMECVQETVKSMSLPVGFHGQLFVDTCSRRDVPGARSLRIDI